MIKLTIEQHDARCTKVLYVDLTSLHHAQVYGGAARLFCYDGHSAYVPIEAPVVPARPEIPDPPIMRECRCGASYDAGANGTRKYCPPCTINKKAENLLRRRAPKANHCSWRECELVIPSGERYCSASHQKLANAVYSRVRRERQQQAMAGVFSVA